MRKKPFIILCLLFGYMAVIFALSCLPADESIFRVEQGVGLYFSSKLKHIAEYAGLGVLAFCFFQFYSKLSDTSLVTFFTSSLYGVSDEVHQFFVPTRNCSIVDVVIDAFGVFIGVLLAFFAFKLSNFFLDKKKSQNEKLNTH